MTAPTTSRPTIRVTPRMTRLIAHITAVVARGLPPEHTVHLIGERLALHLGAADLLTPEQREGDPAHYRQHLLHAEEDGSFSVVALVWLPGQQTAIHDHVSWCVTGVHQGQESERRYRLEADPAGGPARLVATEDLTNALGDVCGFAPPGDIHRVCNSGAGTAISLHVYGADIARLGSSVRRVYPLPGQ
ncbi:cysteine dioxygenase [Streptomyces sp. NPDC006879]|uniref:cysteine dioxygenase family protein n=1 Tax=Streptomyces sp. NPDC006879 TaxID=3364767 RepID=UPI0036839764